MHLLWIIKFSCICIQKLSSVISLHEPVTQNPHSLMSTPVWYSLMSTPVWYSLMSTPVWYSLMSTPVWYSLMCTPAWYSVNYDNIHCSLQHIHTFLHCTHSTPFVQMLQYNTRVSLAKTLCKRIFQQLHTVKPVAISFTTTKQTVQLHTLNLIQWPTPSGIKILTNVCAVTLSHSHTCTFFVLKLLPVLTVNNYFCTYFFI